MAKPDKRRYVGLDVHKKFLQFAIIDQDGQLLQEGKVPMDRRALQQFAEGLLQPSDEVALESTTNAWAVADLLEPYVAKVVVSNALATKAIAWAKVKTDKVDARVLAQLLRCDYLPEVWRPDETTRRMRRLSNRRMALVKQTTMARNRIHAALAQCLIHPEKALFSKAGQRWLEQLLQSDTLPEDVREAITHDLDLLRLLEQQIQAVERSMAQAGHESEDVRLLLTMHGIGLVAAVGLSAVIGPIDRFTRAEQLVSYLGLCPQTKQSGARSYHGPITKQGSALGRFLLIEAAHHYRTHPGPLGVFFRRLKARKGYNKAVTAVARKLAVIIFWMLKQREPYRYAYPTSTQQKLSRLRIVATGVRRRSGLKRGQKKSARLPGGSRVIKSLDRVYEEENLPRRRPLPAGEQRVIRETGAGAFVASIAQEHIVPRKGSRAWHRTPQHEVSL